MQIQLSILLFVALGSIQKCFYLIWKQWLLLCVDRKQNMSLTLIMLCFPLFCFTDTEIFLIYNKVSKLCLQASVAQSVRTATCHQDNESQKFTWITDHQLMSVRLNLCLGVPLKEDEVAITLFPCNQTSELQWWECRNESLLAIQGEDLFFSPGKEEHDNVVLKKRLSPKNNWKIYGAMDVLCSQRYEGTENWIFLRLY